MLPRVCTVEGHSRFLKKNVVLLCHYFVHNSFWRHLWSITEQTLGNVESTYQFSWNFLWWWDEWILSYKGSNLSEVTPPHPSQVLPPSLEADANHVWIVDQLRNKKHR